jgi:hypothetical protein
MNNELIQKLIENTVEAKSTTRVRKWVVKTDEGYYAVLQYWKPPVGDCVGVFKSDKRGNINRKEELFHKFTKDHLIGIQAIAELLSNEKD